MKKVLKPGGYIIFMNTGANHYKYQNTQKIYFKYKQFTYKIINRYSLWFFGRYVDRDWNSIINSVEDLQIVKSDTILKDSVNIFII